MRWQLYTEEYSPDIQYIPGPDNVIADALSCLPKENITPLVEMKINQENFSQEAFLTCFESEENDYSYHPLSYAHLRIAQQADKTLMKILQLPKTLYHLQDFHGGGKSQSLVCYKTKIVVPKKLQRHIIEWYHTVLCHPGINRTEETIGQHL